MCTCLVRVEGYGAQWYPGFVLKDHLHWWHVSMPAGLVSICLLTFHAYLSTKSSTPLPEVTQQTDACLMKPLLLFEWTGLLKVHVKDHWLSLRWLCKLDIFWHMRTRLLQISRVTKKSLAAVAAAVLLCGTWIWFEFLAKITQKKICGGWYNRETMRCLLPTCWVFA